MKKINKKKLANFSNTDEGFTIYTTPLNYKFRIVENTFLNGNKNYTIEVLGTSLSEWRIYEDNTDKHIENAINSIVDIINVDIDKLDYMDSKKLIRSIPL